MQQLILDGKKWKTPDDLYDAFFKAVGAPSWHGRNFNALRDSIVTGRINKIELPYVVRIKNYASIGAEAKIFAADFVKFFKELHESGSPVDIEIDS